jgi:hypothetical protein
MKSDENKDEDKKQQMDENARQMLFATTAN